MTRLGCILALISCIVVARPSAQAPSPATDPVESARIQLGPFGLTPGAALTNIGVDSNVFNELENPKRDFTATVSPQLDGWFRAGRSRTSFTLGSDLVYFHRYAGERSVDGDLSARLEVPGNRLTPWVLGGYRNGRQRVGHEIDLRSRRLTADVALGVQARVGARGVAELSVRRTTFAFDGNAVFLGSNLRRALNRRSQTVNLGYAHAFTIYTKGIVEAEAAVNRFESLPERDSDTVRIQVGVDLDERALIGGRVRVGYRKFEGVGGRLSDFSGVVASIATKATLRGRTRLEVAAERDVDYSYELQRPYYVLTSGTLTVTPRLSTDWDIRAMLAGQRLAYRSLEGASLPNRVDRHITIGVGAGYYLARRIRIGFNVNRERRRSPLQSRDYVGYRLGSSVTYGP